METQQTLDTRALRLAAPATHRPFRTATVLGAGTMGAQIAAHLANAGLDVHLLDIPPGGDGSAEDKNAVVRKGFEAAKNASPDPFFTEEAAGRVTLGNFDEDFDAAVGAADWVIEAVVERLGVKHDVMERIEKAASSDAVISTNTSGLPIHEVSEGRSDDFKARFLGTHFFNPPRYLKLLELVPTEATAPEVTERVAQFGRLRLGKGIVVANDVPYFVGNRIGVYGQLQAIRYFTEGDYSIEEIDTLTGTLVGHPKSATFRTADVVGLDVLQDVAENLYEKATDDESRDVFRTPDLLDRLVENDRLGAKSGEGFYKKEDGVIKSVDPETLGYEAPSDDDQIDVSRFKKAGALDARLNALYEDDGRAGRFFRETTLDLLAYSARRIGETKFSTEGGKITDNPADVDRAIRWGFGWERGPFQTWDALGFEKGLNGMRDMGYEVPDWVEEMRQRGPAVFYRLGADDSAGERHVYVPAEGGHAPDPRPQDEISLARVKTDEANELWTNEEAALLNLGDGVACYEFRSKSNALGQNVVRGLREVIDKVENDRDLRGLVIGNEGKNFSVGANLSEFGMAAMQGDFGQIEDALEEFQEAIQRVRYSEKPVVAAPHQKVLGGGCEMVMACPQPVASAESYIGLVELGVGLIPAGTGTMRLAALADERAPDDFPSHQQPFLQRFFEQVAQADVAESAEQARDMGYLPENTRVVMNADRRLYAAKEEVLRCSNQGYRAPLPRKIKVLGRPTRSAFVVALQQYLDGGFISEYDKHLGEKLAWVMTGGDLTAPQRVSEDYLLGLEREAFLSLLGEEKTQARIRHMLEEGKPLRN
jgi:3-hydroxyacyl-CoA dehydrogenase